MWHISVYWVGRGKREKGRRDQGGGGDKGGQKGRGRGWGKEGGGWLEAGFPSPPFGLLAFIFLFYEFRNISQFIDFFSRLL